MRFKRHTFVELTRRAPIPSVANANANANANAAAPRPGRAAADGAPDDERFTRLALSRARTREASERGVPRFAAALVRWRRDWRARRRD